MSSHMYLNLAQFTMLVRILRAKFELSLNLIPVQNGRQIRSRAILEPEIETDSCLLSQHMHALYFNFCFSLTLQTFAELLLFMCQVHQKLYFSRSSFVVYNLKSRLRYFHSFSRFGLGTCSRRHPLLNMNIEGNIQSICHYNNTHIISCWTVKCTWNIYVLIIPIQSIDQLQ